MTFAHWSDAVIVRLVPNQESSIDVTAVSLSVSFGPHGGVPVKKYIQAMPITTKTNRIINIAINNNIGTYWR